MMFKKSLSAIALLATVAPAWSANEGKLPEIVITATRTAVSVDDTIAPVTVIDRQTIERSQASDITELLAGQPGIDMTVSGGYGKLSSMFVRGTNSDHVLILIDGIKLTSATNGAPSFQHIPLNQIERIEIVRGPRSAIYGSEAVGAVIQIFTRKGAEGFAGTLTFGGGSHETAEATANLRFGNGSSSGAFDFGAFATDGIDARSVETTDSDDDGYRNINFGLRLEHAFGRRAKLNFGGLYSTGENDYDGFSDQSKNRNDFTQHVLNAALTVAVLDRWDSKLQVGTSRDLNENFVIPEGSDVEGEDGRFDTRRTEVSWQNDISIGDKQLLTLGADWSEDDISHSYTIDFFSRERVEYPENKRDNLGLYGQWQGQFAPVSAVIAVRHDDDELFGNHSSGNIDLGIQLPANVQLTLGAGTAFKAPSFNELYFPGFGNPNLDSERSRSYEVGLAGKQTGIDWQVNVFRTEISDLITFVFNEDDFSFLPFNVDEAEITGAEAQLGKKFGSLALKLTGTWIDTENVSQDENNGNELPRRAELTGRFDADYSWCKWDAGMSVIAQSDRFDDAGNTVRVAGYGIVNARFAYAISDTVRAKLKVDNILDKEYERVSGFRELDRRFFASIELDI